MSLSAQSDSQTVLYSPDSSVATSASTGGAGTSMPALNATSGTSSPFVINITWDASVQSAPSGFTSAVMAAVQYLESQFSNPVTLNIDVGYGEAGGNTLGSTTLGESEWYLSSVGYGQLVDALKANASSAAASSAIASLPANAPVNGTFWTTAAQAKALGLTGSTSSSIDGYVGFSNSIPFTYNDSNGVASGTYDFNAVVIHEISEVMGRALLTGATFGTGTNNYSAYDLFHYAGPGVRDFSPSTPGYFSIDGGLTSLAAFNTLSNGDAGDWASSVSHDAFDAFSSSGTVNLVSSADLTALNAIGWQLAAGTSGPAAPAPAPAAAPNVVAGTISPGPGDIVLRGVHTDYRIAVNPAGGAVIQDMTPGRDGTQTPATLHDIIFADGIAKFDPTGNAEEAARIYQAALDRAPDPNGLDYWTAQLDSGTLGLKNVALSFINSAEFQAKYGGLDNQNFVEQLYQNVLHRTGDPSGIQYWTDQLNSGTNRAVVLLGFSDSIENKNDTVATIGDKDRSEAYRLYQAAFDRVPDSTGLDYWTAQMDQGATPLQVAQDFVNSNEFAQLFTGLDNTGFVDQLYQNVLHRAPDASGEQYWVGQLNQGMSRAQALLGFSDSLENRLNTSAATHDGWVYLGAQT